jgi:hypothetical protein
VRFPGRIFIETEVVSQVALFRRESIASAHRSFSLAEGMRLFATLRIRESPG